MSSNLVASSLRILCECGQPSVAGTPVKNCIACQGIAEIERLRAGLQFYADKGHFHVDMDAWDTVSGEPQNFWCDEAGTATVEDGSVAKAVLAGIDLSKQEEFGLSALQPFPGEHAGEGKL